MTAFEYVYTDADAPEPQEDLDLAELAAVRAETNGHVATGPADRDGDEEPRVTRPAACASPELLAPIAAGHHSLPVEEFAAVEIPIAAPLIGGADTRLMPAASTIVFYGEGGSGKTTLTIDLAFHLAAGVDWLEFPIPQPVRVMLLENEGPIDEYRLKIRRKLASWTGPTLGGRLRIHASPWGRVDLRSDAAINGLAEQLAQHETDVLIAGPVRRLGLEGGGTPAETVAYMQLLDKLRTASGRPIAIGNVHHENKGGDISGAFEAEFDTVVHVRADGRDRTQIAFRKCRWSSKIHRSRMTLAWVLASEGFGLLESDLDGPIPAAARTAEEAGVLEWLTNYVTAEHAKTGAGVPKEKAATAYHEAHDNHGRNRARRVIDAQIGLAAALTETPDSETDRRDLPTLAAGPGETRNGKYLYPASLVPSPLAAAPNGEGGEHPPAPDSTGVLATSPPPIEKAAAGEGPGESNDQEHREDELDRLAYLAREAAE